MNSQLTGKFFLNKSGPQWGRKVSVVGLWELMEMIMVEDHWTTPPPGRGRGI